MAITTFDDMQEPYRQIEMRIDFGRNASNQVVQKEIPELVQYDSHSGLLVFDFYNKGIRVDLSQVQIGINFLLPSGVGIHDAITSINVLEARATYSIPTDVLQETGTVIGDVALYKDKTQITSSVKFKLNVIKGISTSEIVDNENYPILQTLMNQVQSIVDEARNWGQEFQDRNEEINMIINNTEEQFNQVANDGREQFTTQLEMQDQQFDDMLNEKSESFTDRAQAIDTHFTNLHNDIDTNFTQLYRDIDDRFNQDNIDAKVIEKIEELEGEYADTFNEVKEVAEGVREVANEVEQVANDLKATCLKYRIVE